MSSGTQTGVSLIEFVYASRTFAERIDWAAIQMRFDSLGYGSARRGYAVLANAYLGFQIPPKLPLSGFARFAAPVLSDRAGTPGPALSVLPRQAPANTGTQPSKKLPQSGKSCSVWATISAYTGRPWMAAMSHLILKSAKRGSLIEILRRQTITSIAAWAGPQASGEAHNPWRLPAWCFWIRAGFQTTRRLFPAASKKVRLPPTWGMRAGAIVATMQAWLTEQPVANYFDTRSGLPETPGRRRDRWLWGAGKLRLKIQLS
jgi:hypothetical protein